MLAVANSCFRPVTSEQILLSLMFSTLLKYISWELKAMHNATQKWPLFIISIHKSLYKVMEEPQNIKFYINLWLRRILQKNWPNCRRMFKILISAWWKETPQRLSDQTGVLKNCCITHMEKLLMSNNACALRFQNTCHLTIQFTFLCHSCFCLFLASDQSILSKWQLTMQKEVRMGMSAKSFKIEGCKKTKVEFECVYERVDAVHLSFITRQINILYK